MHFKTEEADKKKDEKIEEVKLENVLREVGERVQLHDQDIEGLKDIVMEQQQKIEQLEQLVLKTK